MLSNFFQHFAASHHHLLHLIDQVKWENENRIHLKILVINSCAARCEWVEGTIGSLGNSDTSFTSTPFQTNYMSVTEYLRKLFCLDLYKQVLAFISTQLAVELVIINTITLTDSWGYFFWSKQEIVICIPYVTDTRINNDTVWRQHKTRIGTPRNCDICWQCIPRRTFFGRRCLWPLSPVKQVDKYFTCFGACLCSGMTSKIWLTFRHGYLDAWWRISTMCILSEVFSAISM